MRGESVRQAQRGGELRSVQAGAENPERDLRSRAGHRYDRLVGLCRREQRLQLEHVPWKLVGIGPVAAQRARRALVSTGRAPQREIDAAWIERLQRAEVL